MDRLHQKKAGNGSSGPLHVRRTAKLAEAICSWLRDQLWGGGKTSQQTVVTEGSCGKMVKFGLKQAVSLVMSCCEEIRGALGACSAFRELCCCSLRDVLGGRVTGGGQSEICLKPTEASRGSGKSSPLCCGHEVLRLNASPTVTVPHLATHLPSLNDNGSRV